LSKSKDLWPKCKNLRASTKGREERGVWHTHAQAARALRRSATPAWLPGTSDFSKLFLLLSHIVSFSTVIYCTRKRDAGIKKNA
jgi:hypothetical protein